MTSKTRKRIFDAVRVVICGAAIWFVVQGVTVKDHITLKNGQGDLIGTVVGDGGDPITILLLDGEQRSVPLKSIALDEQGQPHVALGLGTAWRNSGKGLLLLAVLMHFPVTFLQSIRLKWLLGAQTIRIGYRECIKFTFAGNFLNFVTPLGSHAGDVFKAFFVAKHTDRKTEAVTTIALDRAIGLGTLILSVAVITTVTTAEGRLAEFRPYVLTVFAVGVVGLLAYFSQTMRKYFFPANWLSRLSFAQQLQRIDQAAHTLAAHKRVVVGAVLASVALQLLAVGAYFMVAVALAMDAHVGNMLEYFAYFYTGAVIQALPGPPQGLGTVELAYRYFLSPFGNASQIICVAFLVRIVVLVCSLPGLLVTLTGSYRPQDTKSQANNPHAATGIPAEPKRDLITS
jgi:uncharacterized protein (TIRG00374 family)